MDAQQIITAKRDGDPLKEEQLSWLIDAYVRGSVPDYQMSAFLMAVYFQGMTGPEVTALTRAMIHSGSSIDLSGMARKPVDKHSTGGVGDKISLLLAPLAAAAGVPVPMMSGRGLGHTGGTLDKLEAIPGLRTDLSLEKFMRELRTLGYAMGGQTQDLVPADKKMYALRDVTGTVPSIPLICASIISKKKAEGAEGLVLDVKAGKGAFLTSRKEAESLARALVHLGNSTGMRTIALLTDMDEPIGYTVGNWLETKEAVLTLKHGHGPHDVVELTTELGALMLITSGIARGMEEGREIITGLLENGSGFDLFRRMVAEQGGDTAFVDDPDSMDLSPVMHTVRSAAGGFIASIDALAIGQASVRLGAGRQKLDDVIDPLAGIVLCRKVGEAVEPGEDLAVLHTARQDAAEQAEERLRDAWHITKEPVAQKSRIITLYDEAGLLTL